MFCFELNLWAYTKRLLLIVKARTGLGPYAKNVKWSIATHVQNCPLNSV